MKLQPAVKKETNFIMIGTAAGSALAVLAIFVLHMVFPGRVSFGPSVFAGAAGGCAVAVLNFFLMALTVQKVAAVQDPDVMRKAVGVSYRNRILLQLAWVAAAITAPFIHMAAGIVPLFIPSALIKLRGIFFPEKSGS